MEPAKKISDVIQFLDYLETKSILPRNTTVGKKVAINKFFESVDDNEQIVSYAIENFDSLYNRFVNRNKTDMMGSSMDAYRKRVRSILEDFVKWNENPTQWVKDLTAKRTNTGNSSSKPAAAKSKAPPKSAKPTDQKPSGAEHEAAPATRRLSLPISPEIEIKVEIPMEGLTVSQLTKLGMFLYPYCNDVTAANWASVKWPAVGGSENH